MNSGFGFPLSMRHSSIFLDHFMAYFDTRLLYSSSALMNASFFCSSGSFIISDTLFVTSIDIRWWNYSSRYSSNFFWTTLASKIPSQWSSTKNWSINSLYFSYNSVHWPLLKLSWLSYTRMHLLHFGQFLQFFIVQCLQLFDFTFQLLNATAEVLDLSVQSLYYTLT